MYNAGLIVDLGVRGSVATDVQCWSDCRFRCKSSDVTDVQCRSDCRFRCKGF
jgi:hypothetical protein